MLDLCRRGFLKLGVTMAGGIAIAQYSMPDAIAKSPHPWVTDMGDYYIVDIPDFKRFSYETLDKPVVMVFGERAEASNLEIKGFLDMHFPKSGTLKDCRIDASQCNAIGRKFVIDSFGENSGGIITRNSIILPNNW